MAHPICRLLLPVILISTTALSGCSGGTSNNSPTSPSTINLTGAWSGDFMVQDSTARMTWTLTQVNGSNTVAGPVVLVLPSGTVLLNGALAGTLSGSTLTFIITVVAGGIPSQPSCTGQLGTSAVAAIATTSTLSGTLTVVASSCSSPVQTGPFTLTKS